MSLAADLTAIETWLYQTLSADADLSARITGVYVNALPGVDFFAEYPCLLVTYQGGSDTNGLGASRLQLRAEYAVRAVGLTESTLDLAAIAARIDQLLHGAAATLSGESLACWRVRPFQSLEIALGEQLRHFGGVYTFLAG